MREVKIKNTLLGILVGTSLLSMSGCTEKGIESGKQHTKSSEERNMSDEEKEILEGRKQAYKDAGFTDEQITMLLMDEKEFAEFAMANPEKIEGDCEFYINKYFDTMNMYYSGQYQEQQSDEEIESKIDWSKAPDFEQEYSEEKINGEFFLWGDYHKGWMMQNWNKMTPEERKQKWIETEKARLSENYDREKSNESLSKQVDELFLMKEKLQNADVTLISKEDMIETMKSFDDEYNNIKNTIINKAKNNEKIEGLENELSELDKKIIELSNKKFLLIGSNPFADMHDEEYNLIRLVDYDGVTISGVSVEGLDEESPNKKSLIVDNLKRDIEKINHLLDGGDALYDMETIISSLEKVNTLYNEEDFNKVVNNRIEQRLEEISK